MKQCWCGTRFYSFTIDMYAFFQFLYLKNQDYTSYVLEKITVFNYSAQSYQNDGGMKNELRAPNKN